MIKGLIRVRRWCFGCLAEKSVMTERGWVMTGTERVGNAAGNAVVVDDANRITGWVFAAARGVW